MIKNYFKLIVALVFVSNVMAQNVPSYVPTNGLVGWWPFNGNANDESGNGNHGTVNGANLTTDRNGKANGAYSFRNGKDLICTTNSFNSPSSLSYSIWINTKNEGIPLSFNNGQCVHGGNWDRALFIMKNEIDFYTFSGNQVFTKSNSNILDSNWHHLVVTMNQNGTNIYLDGYKIITNPSQNSAQNYSGFFRIGGLSPNDLNNSLIGQLDDIAIYNRALTQQEITALYNGGSQSALASTKVYVDAPATVNQNDTLQLSISTEALNTADNVIAYQTDFSYDTTRYTYVGNNLTGTLNPSGNAVVNSSKNGKLAISYMSQTALSGAGSLVKLKFKANNTLGQGIFGLSNFLYNTTAVTSLKNDTVNTIDVTPPTAKITYSQNPVRKGDSLLITVNFNEKMAGSPVPQLNLTGQNTLANTNLTKVNDTTYTYWWVVEKGNG
ncbi:MAG: LamG-like jellyroll fold domain-containing protein, partial [Crocinitomicaceae bacterium]